MWLYDAIEFPAILYLMIYFICSNQLLNMTLYPDTTRMRGIRSRVDYKSRKPEGQLTLESHINSLIILASDLNQLG